MSKKKEADCSAKELARASRALAMMTKATGALMHADAEHCLLDHICRVLVEDGAYKFCWIGYLQNDNAGAMRAVARFGEFKDVADPIRLAGDLPQLAILDGEPKLERLHPKEGAAAVDGVALSLPLIVCSRAIGALTIYSDDQESFDERERKLLETLVDNVAYGVGMLRLQADRRRAERELKESEARYRILVETAPDAILVHNQGIVIFSNAAAAALFRAESPAALTGKRIQDLVVVDDESSTIMGLESEGAHCAAFEEHLTRFDGTSFAAEVTFAPITFHGVHAHQMFIRDITTRKHVHAQLVQTAKLATLGEMAAGMAHELSQPINIIRMAAEGTLLMIDRGKADQSYQTKQFSLMAAQAGRMAEIIDHIRIFSRKDPGEAVIFDVAETLRQTVDLMEPQLSSGGVRVVRRMVRGPIFIKGRPVQLEQVIINLLTNAQDAINEHNAKSADPHVGEVQISVEKTPYNFLQISVSDNGSGISKENLDRIFEPFFTTKEVGSGTGLGLSVSFGIISSMGGRLRAGNRPSGGALFTIILPLSREIPALPQEDGDASEVGGGKGERRHLLVVDDEKQAALAMGDYFRELGYRVSIAHSGNSAYRLFEKDPADLVITDIRMPDGDGEELLSKLRRKLPNLPMIVVTGHIGATEMQEDELTDRLIRIVKKPVSLGLVAKTVENMF